MLHSMLVCLSGFFSQVVLKVMKACSPPYANIRGGALRILNPRSLATKLRSSGYSTKPATVFHMCVRMVFTRRQVVGVEVQTTSKLSCFEVTYSPQMIQQVLFWRLESSCSVKVRHLWFLFLSKAEM